MPWDRSRLRLAISEGETSPPKTRVQACVHVATEISLLYQAVINHLHAANRARGTIQAGVGNSSGENNIESKGGWAFLQVTTIKGLSMRAFLRFDVLSILLSSLYFLKGIGPTIGLSFLFILSIL